MKPTFEARQSIFRRMKEAGWLNGFEDDGTVYTLEVTQEGREVLNHLRDTLFSLGGVLEEDELAALYFIVCGSQRPSSGP